jgi:hypothetical protein
VRPRRDLVLRGVAKREIAVIPVAAGAVFDPTAVNTPVVHLYAAFGDVRVQPLAAIGGPDAAEVHAERQAEPFGVVRLEPVVRLESAVNAWVRRVVDRDAVRLPVCQRCQNPFP